MLLKGWFNRKEELLPNHTVPVISLCKAPHVIE